MAQIWHCYGYGIRLVATALIRPLAWEPPYAMCVALEKEKKRQKKKVKMYARYPVQPLNNKIKGNN